jgi:sucrose phosphorylase
LLKNRIQQKAFHPNGAQKILALNPSVFSILRTVLDGSEGILRLHNVSGDSQTVTLRPDKWHIANTGQFVDILSGKTYASNPETSIPLAAYEVLWLKVKFSN